ncbi:MAG: RNA polymerase sigma factor [Pseudomonadota bacterium]
MQDWTADILDCIPRLRRFAYTLTGDTSDADDLVQICLEKALRKSSQYTDGGDIGIWLFKIMRNAFIDEKRADGRKPNFVELDHPTSMAQPDAAPAPDTMFAHGEVMAAITALPEDQRIVVALILVNGHSYKEAAQILDVPLGTVMSRLARARRRVEDKLAAERRIA